MKRLICILLTVSTILSLCACGKQSEKENIAESEHFEEVASAKASEMKLVKTVGAVHVTDDSNAQQPVIAEMNLYNGYGVGTEPTSYAWINIDNTKLLKMDKQSHANLEASGRKLKINLDSGSMFFCVLEDLEKDEVLEFATPSTSNMAMSVRGTTGVVEVVSSTETKVILLEGEVSGTVGNESFTLTTGEVAEVTVDASGEASVKTRKIDYAEDVPDYAIREVHTNSDIEAKIQGNGGFTDYSEEMTDAVAYEIYGDVLACYRAALSGGNINVNENTYTRYVKDLADICAFTYEFSKGTQDDVVYLGTEHGFEAHDEASLKNWEYLIHDLNEDGYPELFIADGLRYLGRKDYRIRDCWTTDGVNIKRAITPPTYCESLMLTTNGYLVKFNGDVYSDYFVDSENFGSESYSIFSPENNGFSNGPVAIVECYVTPTNIPNDYWRLRFNDGTMTYFGTRTDIVGDYPSADRDYTFDNYMDENYPLISYSSLNWQPLS